MLLGVTYQLRPGCPMSKTHTFTLLLEVPDDFDIVGLGFADARHELKDELVYLNFKREASTIEQAIARAILEVESQGPVKVHAVIPPGYDAIDRFNSILKLRDEPELKGHLQDVLSRMGGSSG